VELSKSAGEKQSVILNPRDKIVIEKEGVKIEKETRVEEAEPTQLKKPEKIVSMKIESAKILSSVQTELYTSWKEERWIIKGEHLGTLTPILERKFNLNIIYGDNELKEYKFSGTIENETVEQILNAMKLTAPLDYKIDKDTVRLFVDNRLKKNFQKIMRNTK
jgi:ferric-dicitrate binding protein FerR (iron transport regulator)